MDNQKIDDEACRILNMLELMESYKIIKPQTRASLRTKTLAWAYDQTKKLEGSNG
jgi:hypothetical protein